MLPAESNSEIETEGEWTETGEDQPESSPDPNPDSRNTPSDSHEDGGSQTPFSHPSLVGLSEAEIAERLSISDATIREQGRVLNRLNERLTAESNHPAPARPERQTPIPDESPEDPAEFFAAPRKHMREAVREIVKEELGQTIAPFRQNLVDQAVEKVHADMAADPNFPDYNAYRGIIDGLLIQSGLREPTTGTLASLYYMAVGIAAKKGGGSNAARPGTATQNDSEPEPTTGRRPPPPQHRPSNQPLNPGQKAPKVRALTEAERRYARIHKMSDAQFIKYLEADEEEFLADDFDKEGA